MDIDDQGLYAFSGNKWISYDNEEMVKIKSEYIIDNDIGGAMAASINSDDVEGKCGKGTFPLLRSKLLKVLK